MFSEIIDLGWAAPLETDLLPTCYQEGDFKEETSWIPELKRGLKHLIEKTLDGEHVCIILNYLWYIV